MKTMQIMLFHKPGTAGAVPLFMQGNWHTALQKISWYSFISKEKLNNVIFLLLSLQMTPICTMTTSATAWRRARAWAPPRGGRGPRTTGTTSRPTSPTPKTFSSARTLTGEPRRTRRMSVSPLVRLEEYFW